MPERFCGSCGFCQSIGEVKVLALPVRRSVFLAVLVIGLFAALSIGVSSGRAAGKADCVSATFCLWKDSNFSNTRWNFTQANYGTTNWIWLTPPYGPSGSGGNASSAYNNRQHIVRIGDGTWVGGAYPTGSPWNTDCMNPGGYRGNLGNYTYPLSDPAEGENDTVWYFKLEYNGTVC